jgi:hypothetical protein
MRRRGAAFAAVAAALLLCAAHVAASPLVVAPRTLRLSAAPWALAAFDLPAGGDLAVTLRRAQGGGVVASGAAAADAGGAASLTLALAAGATAPSPGLYTLHAASAAAAWTQDANVTLVGSAPFVVRARVHAQRNGQTRKTPLAAFPHATVCAVPCLQTLVLDKMTYKPGDTVHVRALSLTTELLPSAGAQARCAAPEAAGVGAASRAYLFRARRAPRCAAAPRLRDGHT